MSCIRKQIVLHIPADCVGVPDAQTYYDYENAHPGVLDFEVGHLSYSLSSTEKQQYFDYWLLDKNRPLFKERFSPGWMGRGHGFTSFFPCWPRKRRQRPKPQPRSR